MSVYEEINRQYEEAEKEGLTDDELALSLVDMVRSRLDSGFTQAILSDCERLLKEAIYLKGLSDESRKYRQDSE